MPSPPRSPSHLALGRAVRELRAAHGVSQEELGFRCDLHRNYVGAVERGELNPTYGVLLRLCAGLGVALSQLLVLAERRAEGVAVAAVLAEQMRHGRRHRRSRLEVSEAASAVRCARSLPLWNGRLPARWREGVR